MMTATPSAATGPRAEYNYGYIWTISLVAALGGLLFGYDWVVIGGAAKFYEAFFHLKDTALQVAQDASFWEKVKVNAISPVGWAQSCALLGCLGGALMSGALSDRFGRKKMLLLSALLFFVSAIGAALPQTAQGLIVARLIGGIGIGMASMLSPMYISEFSPPHLRGRLVALYQFAITVGILCAYFSNAVLLHISEGGSAFTGGLLHFIVIQEVWRSMFGIAVIPSALFFLLLLL